MTTFVRWLLDLLLRFTRTLDWPLLLALLALMGVGLAVLYSAGNESPRLVMAQGARYGVGLGAMWLLSRVPTAQLRSVTPLALPCAAHGPNRRKRSGMQRGKSSMFAPGMK